MVLRLAGVKARDARYAAYGALTRAERTHLKTKTLRFCLWNYRLYFFIFGRKHLRSVVKLYIDTFVVTLQLHDISSDYINTGCDFVNSRSVSDFYRKTWSSKLYKSQFCFNWCL